MRDLIDDAGTLRKHTAYDSFGNVQGEQFFDDQGQEVAAGDPDAVDTLFGYTGRPFDDETQLQNNHHRWYDAGVGRWLSQDPIGFGGGDANLFRYVGNGSTGSVDPSGLVSWWNLPGAAGDALGTFFTSDSALDDSIAAQRELREAAMLEIVNTGQVTDSYRASYRLDPCINNVITTLASTQIFVLGAVVPSPEDAIWAAGSLGFGYIRKGGRWILRKGTRELAGDELRAAERQILKEIKRRAQNSAGRNVLQDIFSIKRQNGLGDIVAGTRAEAEAIGRAWVNGPNVSRFPLKDGGFGLTDGCRTFRLQFKPKSGQWKANFQENMFIEGRARGIELRNIHMTISDMQAP